MEKLAISSRRLLTCALATILLALPSAVLPASDQRLLWVEEGRLTPQARRVLDALSYAEDFGLDARPFAPLRDAVLAQREGDSGQLDALMNAAASRLIHELHYGRVDPGAAGHVLIRRRAPFDTPEALEQLAAASDALEMLATFEPRIAQYQLLKQALSRYRRIRPDLSSLPVLASARIKPGDFYAGSEKLRWLLAELGDAPVPQDAPASESIYDADIAAAVSRFQRRHGLEPDGVIGPKTYAALTVPVSRRIRQIELTMERWRWLPEILPPAVIVNVPQYMLYTLPDSGNASVEGIPARMPVIVGQSARQTPIFDSAIESVIIRPYWNVPPSIVREELMPLILGDAEYLVRHDMEIVRGGGDDAEVLPGTAASIAALGAGNARLRQRPGPGNALGLIKFDLPNPYSVYLHSTPETMLFSLDRRALSHGCIRVSDAIVLAAYLLKGAEGAWDAAAIEAATCGSETLTVRLANPVPVFILYGTVVIDTDGAVLFFDDVYGHDRVLDELLRGEP